VIWGNSPPAPSSEHKVLKLISLPKLKEILGKENPELALSEDEPTKKYPFVRGHLGILTSLLSNPEVSSVISEMQDSK